MCHLATATISCTKNQYFHIVVVISIKKSIATYQIPIKGN